MYVDYRLLVSYCRIVIGWALSLWGLRAYISGRQWRANDGNMGYDVPILQVQHVLCGERMIDAPPVVCIWAYNAPIRQPSKCPFWKTTPIRNHVSQGGCSADKWGELILLANDGIIWALQNPSRCDALLGIIFNL